MGVRTRAGEKVASFPGSFLATPPAPGNEAREVLARWVDTGEDEKVGAGMQVGGWWGGGAGGCWNVYRQGESESEAFGLLCSQVVVCAAVCFSGLRA